MEVVWCGVVWCDVVWCGVEVVLKWCGGGVEVVWRWCKRGSGGKIKHMSIE